MPTIRTATPLRVNTSARQARTYPEIIMTNIRALQQEYGASRSKLKLHNSAFFNQVEAELDRAKHPADKRRLHNKVHAHCRAMLDGEPAKFTSADQEAVDGWFALLDILEAEIQAATAGNRAAGASDTSASGWYTLNNRGEREAVHLLAPNEAVADLSRNYVASADRLPLGDYLKGIVAGARTPEIKAALSEGTDAAGGYSIPTQVLGEFFDQLRARTCFIQAGARTLMLEGMKTRIMRVDSDPVATWRAENAAVAESEPTFGAIDFVPKSLAVLVKVSQELLDDSVNAGAALMAALTGAMATKLDYACFYGTGAGNEPRGLDNLAGVPTIQIGGANGGTFTWDDAIDAQYQLDIAKSEFMTAMVMHPRSLRTIRKLKDGNGNYTRGPWALGAGNSDVTPPKMLNTTAYPINQVQGTSNDASTIHAGDFTKGILGLRQELTIKRLDQTFAGNLQVGFLAYLRADVGFERAGHFVKMKGVR